MSTEDLIKIVGSLGLGAGGGAIVVALINAQSTKGKSRAEAADIIMSAAERIGSKNEDLEAENVKLMNLLHAIHSVIILNPGEDTAKAIALLIRGAFSNEG